MRELQKIAAKLAAVLPGEAPLALATVVHVEGSSYRRSGAKMLIDPSGTTTGTVSGGCLESDVILQAQAVLADGVPRLLRYDTTSEQDRIMGSGLGCDGIVEVFVEQLSSQSDKAAWLRDAVTSRQPMAMMTVLECDLRGDAQPGRVLLVLGGANAKFGSSGDVALDAHLVDTARPMIDARGRSQTLACGKTHGAARVFVDVLSPAPELFVIGAGADAPPLVELAIALGWRVSVVDHRAAYLTKERFPTAAALIPCNPADPAALLPIPADACVALMTHNFQRDGEFLRRVLPLPLRYLGLLGPRLRTGRLLAEIAGSGIEVAAEWLEKVYAPMGLDLGGEGPEAIAIAALAEMQAVLAGKSAGFLRDRQGPIHDPR